MKDYLNKLIGNRGSKNTNIQDFRNVYQDSNIGKLLISLKEDIDGLDIRFKDQVRSLKGDGVVLKDFSHIKQSGVRGIALSEISGYFVDLLKAYLLGLKQRHEAVGYVTKLSVHMCKNGKETYSYYLKPSLKLQNTQPAEQLFGNLTLSLELHQSIPVKLKCVSTYYSDVNYKSVRSEEEWLSVIFLNEQFNL